jgi:hypothetical protein
MSDACVSAAVFLSASNIDFKRSAFLAIAYHLLARTGASFIKDLLLD